jgi:hypothetical protein
MSPPTPLSVAPHSSWRGPDDSAGAAEAAALRARVAAAVRASMEREGAIVFFIFAVLD